MKNNRGWSIVAVMTLGLLVGCSSTHVQRVDVGETIDLSGRWNDTDSRLVSQEMLDDCLRNGWVDEFHGHYGRSPVVIVGTIVNKSPDHISSGIFTKNLERDLMNSRKVRFVAAPQERQEVRAERQDQQMGMTSPETRKAFGKEVGADFMLQGSIDADKDVIKGRYVILYQVNLELVNLETNEKVWIGQKFIKKVVERSKYSL